MHKLVYIILKLIYNYSTSNTEDNIMNDLELELEIYKLIKAEISAEFNNKDVFMCNIIHHYFKIDQYRHGENSVADKMLLEIKKLINFRDTVGIYLRNDKNIIDCYSSNPSIANQFRLDFVNKKIEELS